MQTDAFDLREKNEPKRNNYLNHIMCCCVVQNKLSDRCTACWEQGQELLLSLIVTLFPECKTMVNVYYCGKVIPNTAIFVLLSESHKKISNVPQYTCNLQLFILMHINNKCISQKNT